MPVSLLQAPPTLTASPVLTCTDTTVACDPPSATLPADLSGTLHIDTHRLVFFSDAHSRGFAIPYQSIVIHALSREDHAHLYCQLDGPFPASAEANGDERESDAEEEEEEEEFAELRFYPKDEDMLDRLFAAMSECAAMNPDEDADVLSDDEHNDDTVDDPAVRPLDDFNPDDFITSEAQLDRLTPAGRLIFERLESAIQSSLPDRQTTPDGSASDLENSNPA
ncbi:hypothetical protein GGI15_003233 [Coemansia interrupta]|uniref:Methylosome subunit pICln n=1 Tax=Coemansia interrupta TaxID=1126814 RepID=A0A9W8HAQ2_9FUNG|nr:hypothetical protein GGI15_003233 [Coemansia interrupta]